MVVSNILLQSLINPPQADFSGAISAGESNALANRLSTAQAEAAEFRTTPEALERATRADELKLAGAEAKARKDATESFNAATDREREDAIQSASMFDAITPGDMGSLDRFARSNPIDAFESGVTIRTPEGEVVLNPNFFGSEQEAAARLGADVVLNAARTRAGLDRAPTGNIPIVNLQNAFNDAQARGDVTAMRQIKAEIDARGASGTFDVRNVQQPQPAAPTAPQEITIDPSAALGTSGVLKNAINVLADSIGAGLVFQDTEDANAALNTIGTQTTLSLSADVEGRPSNFTRELIQELTIRPGEFLEGAGRAAAKSKELLNMITQEIARIDDDILGNPRAFSAKQVSDARANRSQLAILRNIYAALGDKFEEPPSDIDLNQFFRNP